MFRKARKIITSLIELYLYKKKEGNISTYKNNACFSSVDFTFNESSGTLMARIFHEECIINYSDFNCDPFNNKTWPVVFHHLLNVSKNDGADIKVPWEIGRLNFITEKFIREGVKSDELVNIISSKPLNRVGFGVQWKCAMDVAIRAINLVLIDDLQNGYYNKHQEFRFFLAKSLDYISLNFEKYGNWRGNHYLTNLVGILVVASHFDSKKYNKLFDFALSELEIELDRQFLADGTNFEGSTAYHNFGLELLSVVHTVLCNFEYCNRSNHYKNPYLFTNIGIKKVRFNPEMFERVLSALDKKIKSGLVFSLMTMDQNGDLIQIGDNDSGKVFRTCYVDSDKSYSYLDIIYQITESLKSRKFPIMINDVDYFKSSLSSPLSEENYIFDEGVINSFLNKFEQSKFDCKNTQTLHIKDISFPKTRFLFHSFGLLIVKGKNSTFTFRCGNIGQEGKGGHDHYDQLSITLFDSGNRIISDPGVGCYTKDVTIRNKYRSSDVHYGLVAQSEMDDLSNLFSIKSNASKVIYWDGKAILAKQTIGNIEKYRHIEFAEGQIKIRDLIINDIIKRSYLKVPYSPSYGIINNE